MTPGSTDRTAVRRFPERAVHDVQVLYGILDSGMVAHLAVLDEEGQPYVLPVGYARRGHEVIFHGSSGSRLFRALADGNPTCLTVTLLDGVVLARSSFESSMNYRSVIVLGRCRTLHGDDEVDALRAVSEQLLPGRWSHARPPTKKELAATLTLALSLDECSVKVSNGGPQDDPNDLTDPIYGQIWAGRVPLTEVFGEPLADELTPEGVPVPDYIRGWERH